MAFTYFFRDRETLDQVAIHALPELKTRMYINIWDAGCAMGPEAYSLAITLRENMGHFLFRNVRIYATDIDEQDQFGPIIQRGVYHTNEVKRIPAPILEKYFTPLDGSEYYQVNEEIRKAVNFIKHDLLSLQPIRDGFGMVVCKNVLLHFSPEDRVKVIQMFHRVLIEGGYFVTEQTQKMPSEAEHLFQQVVWSGQLFQKRNSLPS